MEKESRRMNHNRRLEKMREFCKKHGKTNPKEYDFWKYTHIIPRNIKKS